MTYSCDAMNSLQIKTSLKLFIAKCKQSKLVAHTPNRPNKGIAFNFLNKYFSSRLPLASWPKVFIRDKGKERIEMFAHSVHIKLKAAKLTLHFEGNLTISCVAHPQVPV